MIEGIHTIVYSRQADAMRTFFREVMEWDSVDAGGGWPIFALPPAELAVHPTDGEERHELYLMCSDLEAARDGLRQRGVECGEPVERPWGVLCTIRIPGGGELAMYEPRHPSPLFPSPG